MNAATFERAEKIFHAAWPIDAPRRGPILDAQCGDDTELRNLVEELLKTDAEGVDPTDPDEVRAQLEAILADTDEPEDTPSVGLPEHIGAYRISRCIAVGGMATVYEAEQESPRRRVALKTLHRGAVSKKTMGRFDEEVEVLARMQHPGIARIIEAGTCNLGDGKRPFFAMDYVDGPNLLEYAARHQLGTADRLALFLQVCDAVSSAHAAGIIHRDLKPQNILVNDAVPARRDEASPLDGGIALGQPIVLDFGVARAIEPCLRRTHVHTDVGRFIGTLAYMSPEQFAADTEAVTVRSDVYTLGVVLFELLSGRLPHDVTGRSMADAIELIREHPCRRLGDVDRRFRGDLDTIVARMLTEPARRYVSVAAVADDVRRHLRHEPIRARTASARYRLKKVAQRNPALVGVAATLAVVVLVGALVTAHFAGKTRELPQEDEWSASHRRASRADGTAIVVFLRDDAIALVAIESGETLGSFGAGMHPVLPTLSDDGRWLAAVTYDDGAGPAVRGWDTLGSETPGSDTLRSDTSGGDPGWRLALPPDVTPLRLRLSRDARFVALVTDHEVRVIETDTGVPHTAHIPDGGRCRDVLFDTAGERFVVLEDEAVVTYDLRTGVELSHASVER